MRDRRRKMEVVRRRRRKRKKKREQKQKEEGEDEAPRTVGAGRCVRRSRHSGDTSTKTTCEGNN